MSSTAYIGTSDRLWCSLSLYAGRLSSLVMDLLVAQRDLRFKMPDYYTSFRFFVKAFLEIILAKLLMLSSLIARPLLLAGSLFFNFYRSAGHPARSSPFHSAR